eukprot:5867728-Pyramimonas_sp.AAC.1
MEGAGEIQAVGSGHHNVSSSSNNLAASVNTFGAGGPRQCVSERGGVQFPGSWTPPQSIPKRKPRKFKGAGRGRGQT